MSDDTVRINAWISIPLREIRLQGIRAQGAGGQNVNKVASAVHLQFDIPRSSLPHPIKQRLLGLRDGRISREGVFTLKAQRHRTWERNREDALQRLAEVINSVTEVRKKRLPTRPTRGSQKRRLEGKQKHARTKKLRGKVDY